MKKDYFLSSLNYKVHFYGAACILLFPQQCMHPRSYLTTPAVIHVILKRVFTLYFI